VGISVYHGEPVKEEFLIPNPSECSPKSLDFGIERLGSGVRRPVVIEVEDIIIMLIT